MRRRVVELDAAWIAPAGLDAVDALARLQLAATRRGFRLRLDRPPPDLLDLLRLAGLAEVFGVDQRGTASPSGDGRLAEPPGRRQRTWRSARRMPR